MELEGAAGGDEMGQRGKLVFFLIPTPAAEPEGGHSQSPAGWSGGYGGDSGRGSPLPETGVLGRALSRSQASVSLRSARVSFRKGSGSARCAHPAGKRGMLPPPSFLLPPRRGDARGHQGLGPRCTEPCAPPPQPPGNERK